MLRYYLEKPDVKNSYRRKFEEKVENLLIVTKVLEHILNIFHFDDYTLMQACLKNSSFAGEL